MTLWPANCAAHIANELNHHRACLPGTRRLEYGEKMLHRRLAATVLVMALVAANTATAAVCRAYCAGVGNNNAAHHHQTETRVSAPSHHRHAYHEGANCPECPDGVGQSSMQPPDCGNFTQVQALQEMSTVSSAGREGSQPDITLTSTNSLAASADGAWFSPFCSPPQISSFQPVLVSLRV